MSGKRTIWEHPIIAGVSVAAIVGLAIWIFPSVQAISKSVLAFVLGILGTPIPLWVWLLGLGLFVAAGSIKRLWAGQAEADRISTTADLNKISQEVFQSKEPELDEVQTESVEAEWKSYMNDNILEIDWVWRWNDTTIDKLTPLCSYCRLELDNLLERINDEFDEEEWKWRGFVCVGPECGAKYRFDDHTHLSIMELVRKHIRREARRLGLPI